MQQHSIVLQPPGPQDQDRDQDQDQDYAVMQAKNASMPPRKLLVAFLFGPPSVTEHRTSLDGGVVRPLACAHAMRDAATPPSPSFVSHVSDRSLLYSMHGVVRLFFLRKPVGARFGWGSFSRTSGRPLYTHALALVAPESRVWRTHG